MSLKAKLEAVIYAAEEPVTLAQLAMLFAEDALAWKAERDAELARGLEPATEAGVVEGSSEEILLAGTAGEEHTSGAKALSDDAGVDAGAEAPAYPLEAGDVVLQADDVALETGDASLEATDVPAAGAAEPVEAESVEVLAAAVDPEQEARRVARQREREVREILRAALDELIAEYANDSRGIEIREIAGGFRMGTKPEIHDAVRAFVKSLKPPMKLSLPALETLAVIAYKQPVTAPEVGEIRGVDSSGVLGSLMSRKLIATAGRKQVIGRPMLYKTTKEFLLRFGLKDLSELPSMEEFEKMAAMELSEESGFEEVAEAAGPIEESGDLFDQSDADGAAAIDAADSPAGPGEPVAVDSPVMDVSNPAAVASEEVAEAHAPVERQDAEEVEVER
jgi:segregation and condensation protein B